MMRHQNILKQFNNKPRLAAAHFHNITQLQNHHSFSPSEETNENGPKEEEM